MSVFVPMSSRKCLFKGRQVEVCTVGRRVSANDLQLKEVGGFYRDAFAEKDFSLTTNLSAEHNAANFF
jgi:hypothetical protein